MKNVKWSWVFMLQKARLRRKPSLFAFEPKQRVNKRTADMIKIGDWKQQTWRRLCFVCGWCRKVRRKSDPRLRHPYASYVSYTGMARLESSFIEIKCDAYSVGLFDDSNIFSNAFLMKHESSSQMLQSEWRNLVLNGWCSCIFTPCSIHVCEKCGIERKGFKS